MITQTLTNTSTANQNVVYTVTPTSVNGCEGQPFTVTINVGVEPVGTDPSTNTCSDTALAIDLNAITTLTGNTFSWVAADNVNVTGETMGTSTAINITDTLTNVSGVNQVVVYTVSPASANGCAGDDFTVTVTVNPEPVAPVNTVVNSCSDIALNIDFNTMTSLTGNIYSWSAADNPNVTGETTATLTTSLITDTITNTSGTSQNVIYTITPTSALGCDGDSFTITVIVGDEPFGTNDTPTICSDDSVNVDLNTLVNKVGTTFIWTATDNPNVTGETLASSASLINDVLHNVSLSAQIVTYTVTPTNGCVGNDFTVEVTVNPEPVGTTDTIVACSDIPVSINLDNYTTLPDGTNTYQWIAVDNPDVSGETATSNSSVITDTLINVSTSSQIVEYQITPTSVDGCEGDMFIINVQVGQKPIKKATTPLLPVYCSNDVLNISLESFTTLEGTGNTYEWVALDNTDSGVTGETLTSVSGNTITDAIKNTTATMQLVSYTVTPTSFEGCIGDPYTIIVSVNPEPVGNDNIEETACSDVAVDFNLNNYTSLTNNTYVWVATDNPNVTGETLANSTNEHITDTLTNLSSDNQDVIYTVTPTSENGCVGEPFEVKVNVGLEPVGIVSNLPSCSGDRLNINLNSDTFILNFTTNDNIFSWYADNNNNVDGESINTQTDTSITDVLINTTNNLQYVVYHITPYSAAPNTCEGDEFTITVEVGFEPVGTTDVETICHDEALSLDLNSYINNLSTNDYLFEWYAIDNANVTGETITVATTNSIEDVIINTTGVVQIVDYMITPTTVGGCEGEEFLVSVEVNPRPDFELKPQYFICPDVGIITIGEDSNPAETVYEYRWFYANNLNTPIGFHKLKEIDVDEMSLHGGTFVLKVRDIITGCTFTQFTSVSMAEQMIISEVHVSDFNRPDNTITIDVIGGTGTYEYTLHYTDYNGSMQTITQSSPVFEHLVAATYHIEVTDLSGCSVSITSDNIYVLDYPPFFTPNGDLQNDTWQIDGAKLIPNSKIYIFDRFGKVITSLNPNSIGWDGSYRGTQVPASDYWFTAEYKDPNTGKAKTVKGHFSIVRK